jgi:hypothetical protein
MKKVSLNVNGVCYKCERYIMTVDFFVRSYEVVKRILIRDPKI